jgi:hypothetical protein
LCYTQNQSERLPSEIGIVAVSESSRLSEEDTGQALGEVVDGEKFKDLDGYSK